MTASNVLLTVVLVCVSCHFLKACLNVVELIICFTGQHITTEQGGEDYYARPSQHNTTEQGGEEVDIDNIVNFRGNKYEVIDCTVNDLNCTLTLKCDPFSCEIHKMIHEFRRATSLPRFPREKLKFSGYTNMLRGHL